MSGHPSIDYLELLVQNKLDEAQAAEVRAHLESCAACRSAYEECAANEALGGELRSALASSRSEAAGDGAEEDPAAGAGWPAFCSVPGYDIVREVHRGGQGVVYQAIHADTKQVVAIKVMREGPFATRRDKARFDREVGILRQLNHPSIVTVRDAGKASGWFYYVMDYIEGESLDAWVARSNRDIGDTLRLFAKICDAVNAAHVRGVVHRDLKPSNIRIDAKGEPHILDFGLAKAATEDSQASGVTLPGQFLGSLPWASPEQAEGIPTKIDVRTDVYSLGVLLYQMLTGRFPYAVIGAMRDVLDNILRVEPARPSTVRRQINDEVETIVLKCLSKERERRYQIAGEVAQDIRHYLAGEPITAKRDSGIYILKKTLRHYRVAAAVTAGFVALLAVSLVVTAHLYVRAEKARNAEVRERVRADQKAEAADQERVRAQAAEQQARERAEQLRQAVYRNRIALAQNAYDSSQIGTALELLYSCPSDQRGWEWFRLLWAANRRGVTIRGHAGAVMAVAFSPDGDRIASGANVDPSIRIWASADGAEILRINAHNRGVVSLAFTPDGKRIVSAGTRDQTVRISDAATGAEIRALRGHTDLINCVAVDPDGRRIASVGQDRTIRIWDAASGTELVRMTGHEGSVRSVAFSPDGKRLVSGSNDRTVRVWDAGTGTGLLTFRGHAGFVTAVAFSPDGSRIASAAADKTLRFWDATDGREIIPPRLHPKAVNSVAFSPDGKQVATGGFDRSVMVWDAATGIGRVLGAHMAGVACVRFSPDGARIVSASGDNTLRLWHVSDVDDSHLLRKMEGTFGISSVSFSPDGKRVAAAGLDKTVTVWDAVKREVVFVVKSGGAVEAVAFSPDGKWIVSGGRRPGRYDAARVERDAGSATQAADSPMLTIRDAATGAEIRSFGGHEATVTSVTVSRDSRRIVSASRDGTVRVWDAGTGAERLTLRGHHGVVTSAALSPDGSRILSGGEDETLRLWDATTGAAIGEPVGGQGKIVAVVFSPDARRVVLASEGGFIRVRDVDLGAAPIVSIPHGPVGITSLAISPDGKRIVTGAEDFTLRVWDVAAGAEMLTLNGHQRPVWCVGFSPDGRQIVSGDSGSCLRIWDSVSREQVANDLATPIGLAYECDALITEKRYGEAALLFPEAIETHRRLFGETDERTVGLLRRYHAFLKQRGGNSS